MFVCRVTKNILKTKKMLTKQDTSWSLVEMKSQGKFSLIRLTKYTEVCVLRVCTWVHRTYNFIVSYNLLLSVFPKQTLFTRIFGYVFLQEWTRNGHTLLVQRRLLSSLIWFIIIRNVTYYVNEKNRHSWFFEHLFVLWSNM